MKKPKIRKRNTLYLGPKDNDILMYIEPLLIKYDFSFVVRELIRDGIKHREGERRQPREVVVPSPVSQEIYTEPEIVYREPEANETDLLDKLEDI